MSAAGLRFRPPPLAVPPEVRWLLLRAFGPLDAPAPSDFAPEAAVRTARLFDLAPRIAARQGRARLAAELGPEAAGELQRDRVASAAAGIRLAELIRRLAETAAPRGLPLVFLKFAALQLAGRFPEGGRSACDVDVLAPEERTRELSAALVAAGFSASPLPAQEHQLPALSHPEAGVVEIHRVLLGVRAGGKGSATLADLERGGLLLPCAGLPGRCFLPSPAAQVAHALVHGLGQHGFWPRSYPLSRTIADLIDLGLADSGGEELARAAHALVEREVAAAEAEAARALCAALAAGETDPGGDAGELLRHLLAGRLDPAYERALKLALFKPQPSDHTAAGRLARSLWQAVVLTPGQVDAIYGPPATRLGYLGRRLARPFDLLARLLRYGASARAVALRQPAAVPRDPLPALRELASEAPLRVTVRGGSMAPLLADGAAVEVAPAKRYAPGDVVAFRAPDGRLLVHRVLGYRLAAWRIELVTRGDACPRPDAPVPLAAVLGRVALRPGPAARCRALLAFAALAAARLRGGRRAGLRPDRR